MNITNNNRSKIRCFNYVEHPLYVLCIAQMTELWIQNAENAVLFTMSRKCF